MSTTVRTTVRTRDALLLSAMLIVATLFTFVGVRRNGFVNYDDPCYITDNPHVLAGLSASGLRWALTAQDCGNWHPATWMTHMLDAELFGLAAGSHHMMGVAWHIAAALTLLWALFRATGALGRSAFVAFVFALHPLHVQSVAWASERKDLVSTLLAFLTIGLYVSWTRNPSRRRYAAILAVYVVGLAAKPMLVTLPFVLLLLDAWPLGRLAVGRRTGSSSPFVVALPSLILEKLPLFAFAVLSCGVTFAAQRAGGSVAIFAALPLGPRVANATVAYWTYVGQLIWPAHLSFLYPFETSTPAWQATAAAAALAAVSITALRLFRMAPFLAVGWFWYLGTLVPVIGIVQVGAQSRADRYTYLPLVGLFIVMAWGAPIVFKSFRVPRMIVAVIAVAVLAICAVAARQETTRWSDSETLFRRAVAITENNGFAQYYLAKELASKKRDDEAVAHYAEAARLLPEHLDLMYNYGNALVRLGRPKEAAERYERALQLSPSDTEVQVALGMALAAVGRREEAIALFAEAVRLRPDGAKAHYNLGVMLATRGDRSGARHHLEEAIRLDSTYARAREALRRLQP